MLSFINPTMHITFRQHILTSTNLIRCGLNQPRSFKTESTNLILSVASSLGDRSSNAYLCMKYLEMKTRVHVLYLSILPEIKN